jgi:hypothetical protein
MSSTILAVGVLALAAWLAFLCIAKASTILRVSLANAVIACLISLSLPGWPVPTREVAQALALLAVALLGVGLTAYWLLVRSDDVVVDEAGS